MEGKPLAPPSSATADWTTLLRLIGPILNNGLIKMCEEIAVHASGQPGVGNKHAAPYRTEVKGSFEHFLKNDLVSQP